MRSSWARSVSDFCFCAPAESAGGGAEMRSPSSIGRCRGWCRMNDKSGRGCTYEDAEALGAIFVAGTNAFAESTEKLIRWRVEPVC
jgi:hypothetical protein